MTIHSLRSAWVNSLLDLLALAEPMISRGAVRLVKARLSDTAYETLTARTRVAHELRFARRLQYALAVLLVAALTSATLWPGVKPSAWRTLAEAALFVIAIPLFVVECRTRRLTEQMRLTEGLVELRLSVPLLHLVKNSDLASAYVANVMNLHNVLMAVDYIVAKALAEYEVPNLEQKIEDNFQERALWQLFEVTTP